MSVIIFVLPALTVLAIVWMIRNRCRGEPDTIYAPAHTEPFSVAEYWRRLEQTTIDILEEQKPVDQTIILWWGLDGLTLDENGKLKWISRKKPEPVNQNVFYQPCQSVFYADNVPIEYSGMCQNTQATINALQMQNAALQMQAVQQAQFAAIQTCCTPGLVSSQWGAFGSCHYGL